MAGLHCYYKIWNILFKPIDALNCGIARNKVQNVFWRVHNLPISSSLKNAVILCGTNNLHNRVLQRVLLVALLRFDIVLKSGTITLIFLFAGNSLAKKLYKPCLCHRNQ